MHPPLEDLQNFNRVQRQKIDGFTVGRDNVGSVAFKVPVDLSTINLDEICGSIVTLEPRSATVYPVTAKKPPMGKGLNVPARIALEQSWPRSERDKRVTSDSKRLSRHVERLKRIPDTSFEHYDKDSGVWTFSVEHFTTYGLDDSEDGSDDEMDIQPSSATQLSAPRSPPPNNMSDDSLMEDDTFDFRNRRGLPGAFNDQPVVPEAGLSTPQQSFLGISSANSAPNNVKLSLEHEQAADTGNEYDLSDDEDLARTSVEHHHVAEQEESSPEDGTEVKSGTPGGILRARMRAMRGTAAPLQLEVADGDDWAEMLRKTVSPVKKDRQLLRELQDSPSKQKGMLIDLDNEDEDEPGSMRFSTMWNRASTRQAKGDGEMHNLAMSVGKGQGFATSIDLMNSLFERPKNVEQSSRASVASRGFPKVGLFGYRL